MKVPLALSSEWPRATSTTWSRKVGFGRTPPEQVVPMVDTALFHFFFVVLSRESCVGVDDARGGLAESVCVCVAGKQTPNNQRFVENDKSLAHRN